MAWLLIGRPGAVAVGRSRLGLGSGVVETAYFVFLAAAYRRGDLSVVYPVARGVAPLLLVGAGVAVFGERLSWTGWLGVACLVAGFLALQRPWRALTAAARSGRRDSAILLRPAHRRDDRPVHRDRPGRHAARPAAALRGDPVADRRGPARGLVAARGAAAAQERRPGQIRDAAVVGVFTLTAYLLVLIALSVAPLTAVAPLRESAAVVAAGWGAIRLREAADRADATRRIVASAIIVVGAILLALPA